MTGHICRTYGHTIDEIKSDGFEVIDEIQNLLMATKICSGKGLALGARVSANCC